VNLADPGRSQQRKKERFCVAGDGCCGLLSGQQMKAYSGTQSMFRPDWPIVTIITAPGGVWLSPWITVIEASIAACGLRHHPAVMRFSGDFVSFAGQRFLGLRGLAPGGRVSVF